MVQTRGRDATTHHALAGESRQSLLSFLRRRRRAVDAAEAGEAVGLHRNTARTHLDMLVRAGLVTRRLEERTVPGRPRILYEVTRATHDERDIPTDGGYRQLARLLADQLTEVPDARSEAIRAGRRWATTVERRPIPNRALTPPEAVQVVVELLDDLGFEPEPAPSADPERILLHNCPFADVARDNRAIVCAIHLGMLTATFERLDAPITLAGLDPFLDDEPLLCAVRLETRSAPPASPRGGRTRTEPS